MGAKGAAGDPGPEPSGEIHEVHGPVVVIACRRLPPLRRALKTSVDGETYLFEKICGVEVNFPWPRRLSRRPTSKRHSGQNKISVRIRRHAESDRRHRKPIGDRNVQ